MASVLPQEWATLYSAKSGEAETEDTSLGAWETRELREAFKRLLIQQQSPLRLFFLIDGLDEYESNDMDEIIELFTQDVNASPNAKAVVSSRPLIALDALNLPGLTLHDLNHNDISGFVNLKLENDPAFQSATHDNLDGSSALVQYILDESNGLFLWTVLVVKQVISRIRDGDRFPEILDGIRENLPSDLASAYETIWGRIEGDEREGASQILQIVLAARNARQDWVGASDNDEPLTLLDIALAKGDPDTFITEIKPWGKMRRMETCRPVAESFINKWPGFITFGHDADELSSLAHLNPDARIRFNHRSAMEYLRRIETQTLLSEATSHNSFCPYLAHLKANVQHLKMLEVPANPVIARRTLWSAAHLALVAANLTRNTSFPAYDKLLDHLDITMTHHHIALLKDSNGQWIEKTIKSSGGEMEKGDKGRDSKRRAQMNWSNFAVEFSHSLSWEDSFLSLTVQFGLKDYVAKALTSKHGKKLGRPLIDYALSPLPIARYNLITPEVVELLLNYHSNLNKKFEGETSWQKALAWQYDTFVDGKGKAIGGATEAREVAELRLQIFLLLIRHGVDVKTSVVLKPARRIPARKVIIDAFEPWTRPESFKELIKKFDDAVAAAKHSPFTIFKRTIT